jgi:aminopeptidase
MTSASPQYPAPSPFGIPSADLAPGARNAIEVCLGIRRGERVALIADAASREVAASIASALDEVGADCDAVLVEDVATRPMTAAPPRILEVLERVDAGILCVQPEQGELPARMAIVAAVERRAIRYAHMVGVTPQIMQQGMCAD